MIDPRYEMARRKLSSIDRVLLVCSGKGGVGKSVIAASLALALKDRGRKVGLIDLDLHGPSAPAVLGVEKAELRGSKKGLKPVEVEGISLVSVALYTGPGALPIKGRVKEDLVLTLFAEADWGQLDYLVVDMPPGTGDETVTTLRVTRDRARALIVTTPSRLSLAVVRRLVDLLRGEGVPILGVVENLAYFVYKGEKVEVFGPPKAEELGLRLLGRLPIDPELEEALERGRGPRAAKAFWRCIQEVAEEVERTWR